MNRNSRLWYYVGKFSLVHMITYIFIGNIFLWFQNKLPDAQRIALDFYKPYMSIDILVVFTQLIRGSIIALLLYPFYDIILNNRRGYLILSSLLWGVALLCSVEPIPGSIEGYIYTLTSLTEHFMVLIAGGLQALLFSWLFLRFEGLNFDKNYSNTGGGHHG